MPKIIANPSAGRGRSTCHPQNPEGDRGAQPTEGAGDHARVDWNPVVFGKL